METSLRYKPKYDFNPLKDTQILVISHDKKLIKYDIDGNIAVEIQLTQTQIVDAYTSFITKQLKLSPKAKAMLKYILLEKSKSVDKVKIDMPQLKLVTNYNSLGPIYAGLNELISKELIARTYYNDQYFINPTFIKTKLETIGLVTLLLSEVYNEPEKETMDITSDELPTGFDDRYKL